MSHQIDVSSRFMREVFQEELMQPWFDKPGHGINASAGNPHRLGEGNALSAALNELDFNTVSSYRPSRGESRTKEALSALFLSLGIRSAEKTNVLPGLGTSHLYDLALEYLYEQSRERFPEQDLVLLMSGPTYGLFAEHPKSHGFKIATFPLFQEQGWKPHPEIFQDTISRIHETGARVVGYYHVNPHNPTGAVKTSEDLERIRKPIVDNDLTILDDLAYKWLENGSRMAEPFASLPGMFDRTLTLVSLSKSMSCPGLRAGALCGSEEAIDYISNKIEYTIQSVPTPVQTALQWASGELIEHGSNHEIIATSLSEYEFRRLLLKTLLDGERVANAPEEMRAEIRSFIDHGSDIDATILKTGTPFVSILNDNPEGGYFYLLDFSDYEGMYHKGSRINNSTDLAKAFIDCGRLLTLPSEFMLGDEQYPMSLRVTYGTWPKNIVRMGKAIFKTLIQLEDLDGVTPQASQPQRNEASA